MGWRNARRPAGSENGSGGVKNPSAMKAPNILQGCSGDPVGGREFLARAPEAHILAPDLFLYAAELRRFVESADPVTQATAFALGRSYGLKVKTLAGMADCSESTVRRRLRLVSILGTEQMVA